MPDARSHAALGVIWNKLPRPVRDVASEMGKIIDVQMDGALTEPDKTIFEAICDLLRHMVRNACDHGIELPQVTVSKGKKPQGTISLRAFAERGWVVLQVWDGGAGIDAEGIYPASLGKFNDRAGSAGAYLSARAFNRRQREQSLWPQGRD